jgi:hypothetical protein
MPPTELARLLTETPSNREQRRALARITRDGELAEEKIETIGRVTQRAMVETLNTNLVRAQAERIAPEGAEQYAMLAVAGTVEMAQVIAQTEPAGAVTEVMMILILALLALALVVLVVVGLGISQNTRERQRHEQQARAAEREISNIAHKAQTAILSEAIRRTQEKRPKPDVSTEPVIVDGEVLDIRTDPSSR